jgi:hypothetical protein
MRLILSFILAIVLGQRPAGIAGGELQFKLWKLKNPGPNSGCSSEEWAAIANGAAGAPSCDGRLVRMI